MNTPPAPADAALLALASVLHQALGCSWLALTPLRDGTAGGAEDDTQDCLLAPA